MSTRPSYSRGLSFGLLSFGAIALIGVLSSVVTARLYGVQTIGEFALAYAPVGAVWYLSSVREQVALVRELTALPSRAPRATGLFLVVLGFSTLLTLVVGALVLGAAWLVFAGPVHHPELFLPAVANMAVYVVITNAGWNVDAVLSSYRAGRALLWVRLDQALSFLVAATIAGIASRSVWGLVIATGVGAATSLVHRLVVVRAYLRWRVPRAAIADGLRALPQLVRFGLKITPGTVADGVANESGTWILGAVAPLASVGAWSRAWLLTQRFQELTVRVCEMLFPTLVERRHGGDLGGFDRVLVDTLRYSLVGLLLIGAVAAGAANGIMAVFGPGFDRGAPAFAVLMAMPALQTVASILRHALFAVDRPVHTTFAGLSRMAATVGASIPLSAAYGPTGTAAAVVLGQSLDIAVLAPVAWRALSVPLRSLWPLREALALVLACTAAVAAAHAGDAALGGLVGLVAAGLAGTLAFALVLLGGGALNARDRGRLTGLRAQLRQRRRGVLRAAG